MNTRHIKTDTFEALPNDLMTHRETETLVNMALGLKLSNMAAALGVSVESAKIYMGRVHRRLNTHDKGEAVCRAFCLGILRPLCLLLVVSQMATILATPANPQPRPSNKDHSQGDACCAFRPVSS